MASNGKMINIDKLLAYLEGEKKKAENRAVWQKGEARAFEEGYARCLSNLHFAIATANCGKEG